MAKSKDGVWSQDPMPFKKKRRWYYRHSFVIPALLLAAGAGWWGYSKLSQITLPHFSRSTPSIPGFGDNLQAVVSDTYFALGPINVRPSFEFADLRSVTSSYELMTTDFRDAADAALHRYIKYFLEPLIRDSRYAIPCDKLKRLPEPRNTPPKDILLSPSKAEVILGYFSEYGIDLKGRPTASEGGANTPDKLQIMFRFDPCYVGSENCDDASVHMLILRTKYNGRTSSETHQAEAAKAYITPGIQAYLVKYLPK